MKILYFAKYRALIGRGEEEIRLPPDIQTVRALIEYLSRNDAQIAAAFHDVSLVKVALNQVYATLDADLAGVYEVAFFPPVTGG